MKVTYLTPFIIALSITVVVKAAEKTYFEVIDFKTTLT